nr:MAG TPA: hypothetical protein [Caudoviricetes sp.]
MLCVNHKVRPPLSFCFCSLLFLRILAVKSM